jgi:putative ABC transport system permease protein
VILTVIRYELSFDKFHSSNERIYRLIRVSGEDISIMEKAECRTGVSYPVPEAIKNEITALENVTSMEYVGGAFVEISDNSGATRKFREDHGCALVESSFFKVFDFKGTGFKWISGNPDKALNEPFSVVLTKTLAKKYFGEENALGRTLRFERRFDCKVTGVIEDLPPNTDFPFTILVSYATIRTGEARRWDDWTSVNDDHHAYVVLAPGTTKKEIEQQIAKVHAAHTSKEIHLTRHYLLQELSDLHYDPRFGNYNGRTITRETLLALAIVALFLLVTGCINYVNLATAQSTVRSKEIGLRKVMGSNRKNLIVQFLTETFVVVLIAGILALGLASILLTSLHSLLNISLIGYNFVNVFILASLLGIVVFVTLFSGFYPSLMISKFSPVTALKNKLGTDSIGGISLRKVLVVAQFTITQMLVIGTFIVVAQMSFFQNVDMGFNREAVINVDLPDRDEVKRSGMENQLRSLSFVSTISFSYTLPSGVNRSRSYRDIGRPEAASSKDYVIFEYQSADHSFMDLYQIKLLAGRNFTDHDSSTNVLLNKSLSKRLLFENPSDAVGQVVKMNGHQFTVIGVFADFYSNSLKEGVDNIAIFNEPKSYRTASIKLDLHSYQGSLPDAVKQIEKIWSSTYPEYIFDYQFFDDNIKAFYAQEQKYAQLFQLFSFVFLVIGCLGLYGLITFVVNRKGKEVAIRKVLGATINNILLMFSKEYVILILCSFILATPVAYYVANNWLNNFANKVDLEWWYFVMPGFAVLVLALFVVTTKSFGTANANPVDRLKYE